MSPCEPACQEELARELGSKIELGRGLLARLAAPGLANVQGRAKLEKKVRQEVKFLEKFLAPGKLEGLKREHIGCSNLAHQAALVGLLVEEAAPLAVLQPFTFAGEGGERRVVVDIVSDQGNTWVKVVARNARALALNSQGGAQFGQRCILDQVRDLVRCAGQHCVLFAAPTVRFAFANGVTRSLRNKVLRRGATVEGDLVVFSDDESDAESEVESDEDTDEDEDSAGDEEEAVMDDTRVNLDITAMIAYVSALTNGRAGFTYRERILSQQAAWERARPVRPYLDSLFLGKELVCCQSAMVDFKAIIATLGGPGERVRAGELVARVTVVPDGRSSRAAGLLDSGKVNTRSRCIFGTADNLKIVTVTANTGFVRAARGQGVAFAVRTHESRALTEDKEATATPLLEGEEPTAKAVERAEETTLVEENDDEVKVE